MCKLYSFFVLFYFKESYDETFSLYLTLYSCDVFIIVLRLCSSRFLCVDLFEYLNVLCCLSLSLPQSIFFIFFFVFAFIFLFFNSFFLSFIFLSRIAVLCVSVFRFLFFSLILF